MNDNKLVELVREIVSEVISENTSGRVPSSTQSVSVANAISNSQTTSAEEVRDLSKLILEKFCLHLDRHIPKSF